MNKTLTSSLGALIMASVAAFAVVADQSEWTWTGNGSGGWTDAANWTKTSGETEAVYPCTNDIVNIPANMTVNVSDDDMSVLCSVTGVVMNTRSRIVFNVENDYTINRPIGTTVSGTSSTAVDADIVMNGTGSVWLNCSVSLYAYYLNIIVSNGVLRLPQVTYGNRNQNYKTLTVMKPGVLMPVTSTEGRDASAWCQLYGDGTITNPTASTVNIYPRGSNASNPPVFSGRLDGTIDVRNDASTWYQNLTGTGSTSDGDVVLTKNTVVGIGEFGGNSDQTGGRNVNYGSNGISRFLFRGDIYAVDNAKLLYLGTGGICYPYVGTTSSASKLWLDAGETGGLDYRGLLEIIDRPVSRIWLTGDGTKENFFRGKIAVKSSGSVYLTKDGASTWHFTAPTKDFNGVIAVKNGTLRFDNIERAGAKSSLGLGSVLKEDVTTNSLASAADVPYAYLLGNGATVGTMEYTGARDGYTDRPVALGGEGRLLANAGRIVFDGGVTAAGDSECVLRLDGSTTGNIVDNVSDGDGTVKVVKEGSGTWKLGGNLDFTGGLEVKAGTVEIGSGYVPQSKRYSWYRLVVQKRTALGGGLGYFDIGRFGLFNADGEVQNNGLVLNRDITDGNATKLAPGEFTFAMVKGTSDAANIAGSGIITAEIVRYTSDGKTQGPYTYNEEKMFDFTDPSGHAQLGHSTKSPNTSWWPNLTGTHSSWPMIVLRLPIDAGAVTSYDLGTRAKSVALNDDYSSKGPNNSERQQWGGMVGTWYLEGSTDGVNWDWLAAYTNTVKTASEGADNRYAAQSWLSNAESYADDKLTKHTGWLIASEKPGAVDPTYTRFANGIDGVSVSGGGTLVTTEGLTINSLAVDADAADKSGTIDGFAFAAGGTIAVKGTAAKLASVKIPLSFLNAPDLTNVNGWTVSYNGKPVRTVKVYATADGLELAKTGLCVIVK